MPATIYYDNDADLSLLKDKTIAILGYGSQGHAQAQNLRDSGCNVIIGQRPGGANYDLAVSHNFEPLPIEEATQRGDLVNVLLPDEVQGDIYRNQIRQHLQPGKVRTAPIDVIDVWQQARPGVATFDRDQRDFAQAAERLGMAPAF